MEKMEGRGGWSRTCGSMTSLNFTHITVTFAVRKLRFVRYKKISLKIIPEYKYKEHQQHAECGHVVHSLYQHHELPPQGRKEPDQLQNPQQAEGSQY